MLKKIKVLLLLGALVALCGEALAAPVASRIAAVVNNDVVTTYELEEAMTAQLAKAGGQPSPAQLAALRQELLSRLIEEKLIQQRIKALGLQVSDAEVEEAIRDVEEQNRLTRDQLEAALKGQGLTLAAYRENLRQQLLRYRLINQEVRSKVDVSEREIRDYFRAHLDDYRLPATVTLSALSFAVPPQAGLAEREALRGTARQALARLRAGESLETVAAALGVPVNSFGTVNEAELTPEFATALAGVAVGESVLAEVERAIVLLKLEERHAAGLRQFESVRAEITRLLTDQKTEGRIRQWSQGLKQGAFIDIR